MRLLPRCTLLLALLLAAAPAPAQEGTPPPEPRLHVEMAPPPEGGWTVGDRVPVELVLTAPAGLPTPPRLPAWQESWGEAEIVEVGDVDVETRGGAATYRQRLLLAAFRPGTVPLPPREVAVPAATPAGRSTRLSTPDDLALEIASVLPQPAAEDEGTAADGAAAPIPEPRPAQPLREIPVSRAFWITAALLGGLLALLLWLLWRRRRRETVFAGRPDLPPGEELARSLAAARAEASPATALARVSLALRRYLGRRLAFPAAESTSREIRQQLRGRHLPAAVVRRCDELLAACDLVKFARRPATSGDVERWAGAAEEIAAGVEHHLRPAEPPGSEVSPSGATAPSTREAA